MSQVIHSITHVPILVENQEEALQFFVQKLGFEKADDSPMEQGQRWLTVKAPGQAIEIVLQAPDWGIGETTVAERKMMIGKQPGLCFKSSDIEATYAMLQKNGVKTLGKPQRVPWGTQFQFKDLYGNTHLFVGL